MKKLVLILLMSLGPLGVVTAEEGPHLDHVTIDLNDQAALQRGAKYFVNYCQGCHSAKYMRYERLMKDLGLTEKEVRANLMFTGEKIGDHMTIAATPADQDAWFGKAPPDLSLEARYRGTDWLYTYLRSFYLDDSRPFGVNNTVFPDVGMPDVLAQLQGYQKAVFKEETDAEGNTHKVFDHFEAATGGKLTSEQSDKVVHDLVTFLSYIGEPVKVERESLGVKVIIFLLIFTVIAYLLKKEYWRDIH
jgi:ubiquinol-cytochrome c reductase cytochrome c1 subunit